MAAGDGEVGREVVLLCFTREELLGGIMGIPGGLAAVWGRHGGGGWPGW